MPSRLIEETTRWELLVDPGGRPGAENMAIDAGLLARADRTGSAFLRLYRFQPPCLSLGRNEPAAARYDRAAIARRGLDVVRRPSGGPVPSDEVAAGVIEAFRDVGAQHAAPRPSDGPTVRPSVFQDPAWTWRR